VKRAFLSVVLIGVVVGNLGTRALHAQDAARAAGESNTVATSRPAAGGPLHRIRLPENTRIGSPVFSPAGDKLYVQIDALTINIWEVLVFYWPEILGGVTGVIVPICVLALRRIVRRPRLVGELHCRKCNYCLKGAVSERCPECGAPVRRAVKGWQLRWRVAPVVVPLAEILLGYGGLWAWRVPRNCAAKDWVEWWSFDLAGWAARHGVSLVSWQTQASRIVVVDVTRARLERVLKVGRFDRRCALTVTPDGRALLVSLGETVVLLQSTDGRVRHALRCDEYVGGPGGCWGTPAGYGADGDKAYLVAWDKARRTSSMVTWDLASGRGTLALQTVMVETGVYRGSDGGFWPWPPHFYRLPGPGPARFLEMPSSFHGEQGLFTYCRTHVLGDSGATTDMTIYPSPLELRGLTADGRQAWFRESESRLKVVDLQTEVVSELGGPAGHRLMAEHTCCDARRNLVYIEGSTEGRFDSHRQLVFHSVTLVYDASSKRFIGRFLWPSDVGHDGVCATSQRLIAARTYNRSGSAWADELLIFDLATLPHDLTVPIPEALAESQPAKP